MVFPVDITAGNGVSNDAKAAEKKLTLAVNNPDLRSYCSQDGC